MEKGSHDDRPRKGIRSAKVRKGRYATTLRHKTLHTDKCIHVAFCITFRFSFIYLLFQEESPSMYTRLSELHLQKTGNLTTCMCFMLHVPLWLKYKPAITCLFTKKASQHYKINRAFMWYLLMRETTNVFIA